MVEDRENELRVVLHDCRILKIARFLDSLAGRRTEVTADNDRPKTQRLFVGDDARVEG